MLDADEHTAILANPWVYKLDELRLSHSTIESLHNCPRRFEFSKLYACPHFEESAASMSGKVVHAGCQEFMISGDFDKAVLAMLMEYNFNMHITPINENSFESCLGALDAFVKYYSATGNQLVFFEKDGKQIPAVEVPFKINLVGQELEVPSKDGKEFKKVPITFVGYMDAIIKEKWSGETTVMDLKTIRKASDDLPVKFKFSDQCTNYGFVLNKLLGKKVDAFKVSYINILMGVGTEMCQKYDYYKTEIDVEDYMRKLSLVIKTLQMYTKLAWFPRQSSSCSTFGRRCSYFEECELMRTAYDSIQNSLLFRNGVVEQKEFTPLITVDLNLG